MTKGVVHRKYTVCFNVELRRAGWDGVKLRWAGGVVVVLNWVWAGEGMWC